MSRGDIAYYLVITTTECAFVGALVLINLWDEMDDDE
jgi:hypothetical protein